MSILLPQQNITIGPHIGKSYFEDLNDGINATVTVNNNGPAPISIVLTRVNTPVSLTLGVALLLVAGLLTGNVVTFGTIQIATSNF